VRQPWWANKIFEGFERYILGLLGSIEEGLAKLPDPEMIQTDLDKLVRCFGDFNTLSCRIPKFDRVKSLVLPPRSGSSFQTRWAPMATQKGRIRSKRSSSGP
jgi:hypothetical protein